MTTTDTAETLWQPFDASEAFIAGAVPMMLVPLLSRLRSGLSAITRLGLLLSSADGKVLTRWADSDGRVLACPPGCKRVVEGSCLDLSRRSSEGTLVDRDDPLIEWRSEACSESIVVFAVRRNTVIHGFLIVDVKRGAKIEAACLAQLLCWGPILAELLGHSIQATANLVRAVRFSNDFILARDQVTGEHQLRISTFLHILATELDGAHGLRPGFADEIAVFGSLHDIGKVGVPDSILLKPGRFELTEREIMETHVEKGTALITRMIDELQLNDAPGVETLRAAVDCHHEYLDGSGYPRGLQGDEIPLVARMVTIVDIFDALTHYRPYKRPWRIEDAFAHLSSMAGEKLDRDCVNALISAGPRIIQTMRQMEYPEGV